ncbi:MAG: DNA mismatch repair protein MutS [Crocinitomicaceae bacterium]|nr:DNA mismatch repair protein MutS [Crocinitomicaceae bacterium]
MKQYNQIKGKYPDAMLLFRVGDFYECFGDDAIKASKILGIILTKRKNGSASEIALAGFPHHSIDTYLPKLVRAGQRVAICDQLEDPKQTKTIVKRGVTELVTPGVSYNDKILENNKNNFLAAVQFNKEQLGVAFLDISTGEFFVAEGSTDYILKLIQGFNPSEILYEKNKSKEFGELIQDQFYSYKLEDWVFTLEFGTENLQKQFETNSLKGFGIEGMDAAIVAAGAVLHYLSVTQHDRVKHITGISRIERDNHVWLDRFTIRNLELLYSYNENATTLIDILDRTQTPMGSRLMKRWLVLPLNDLQKIEQRLQITEYIFSNSEYKDFLVQHLSEMGDLERLISKVATGKINPKEVNILKRTLESIKPLKEESEKAKNKELNKIADQLNPCSAIIEEIKLTLEEDAAIAIGKGNVIAKGFNTELDELREISENGKSYLESICERESKRSGISTLKIGFNNVFGYYIEVRNTHKDKVPEEWIRKQTLVSAERYITEELKEYENKILGAEEKIMQLESQLFSNLVNAISEFIAPIQHNAQVISILDCLLSFAIVSEENNYCKPSINDTFIIDIKNGRHPVIEKQLETGEEYIPNDIYLNNEDQQIIMITGPNMSGKSAILRQTALIVLMAQIGCFVPASSAQIGVVDKVFTRVGASDNISSGESTFMVEMNETASILNNLSDRSLILLDEIGRGTSTYDGISIAWAIAEYLHENRRFKPKTLFATHYHELNEMSASFDRIKNFNVSVKEVGKKVIFLRKLIPGGSEHSFGIHVAKMAGMPKIVVENASEILKKLESNRDNQTTRQTTKEILDDKNMQLSFFQLDDPVLLQIKDEIAETDINNLTPVEALMKLHEIKKLIGAK